MEKIKPCVCGSKKVNICRTNPMACWVECSRCDLRVQSHATRKEAISQWNIRRTATGYSTIVYDDDKDYKC